MMKLSLFPTEKERFRQVPKLSSWFCYPSYVFIWETLTCSSQHFCSTCWCWLTKNPGVDSAFVCLFVSGLTSQKTSNCLIRKPFWKEPPENKHLSPYLDLVEKLTPIKTPENAGSLGFGTRLVFHSGRAPFWPNSLANWWHVIRTRIELTAGRSLSGRRFRWSLSFSWKSSKKLPWFERKYDFQAQIFSKAKKDGLHLF